MYSAPVENGRKSVENMRKMHFSTGGRASCYMKSVNYYISLHKRFFCDIIESENEKRRGKP